MVKPALAYLDVIAAVRAAGRRARGRLPRERRVRHGQGGGRAGLDRRRRRWRSSTLGAIKRAGADFILTYFAGEVAETARRLAGSSAGCAGPPSAASCSSGPAG